MYPRDVNKYDLVRCINEGFSVHGLPDGFVWARIESGGRLIIGVCGREIGIGADGKPVALDTDFGGTIDWSHVCEFAQAPEHEHELYWVVVPKSWAKPDPGFVDR